MEKRELNNSSLRMLSGVYCKAYKEEDYRLMANVQHVIDLRLNNSYGRFKPTMEAILEEYRGTEEEETINILYSNHVQKR